jgi:hypothetical protein
MDTAKVYLHKMENSMNMVLQNVYLMTILKVTLILYASKIAPKLPGSLDTLITGNTFVKVFLLTAIAFMASHDLQLALIMSVIFVISMNALSGRSLFESFSNYNKNYVSNTSAKLLVPKTMIYPGCTDITENDLFKVFAGDNLKLQKTVQMSLTNLLSTATGDDQAKLMTIARMIGLPYNLEVNDENAPYIATLLVGYGMTVNDKCLPPQ